MRDVCYIVLSEHGIQRMTKRQGGLKRGEVAVRIGITVPDSCLADPTIAAEVVVPASAVMHPDVTVVVEES